MLQAQAAYNVAINGSGGTITNAVTFSNTGTVTLGDASGDSITFTGGVTATAPSQVNIAGTVQSTNTAISIGDSGHSNSFNCKLQLFLETHLAILL